MPVKVKHDGTQCRSRRPYNVPAVTAAPAKKPKPKQKPGDATSDAIRGQRIPLPPEHWWPKRAREVMPRVIKRWRARRQRAGNPVGKLGKHGYEDLLAMAQELETEDPELRRCKGEASLDKIKRCLKGSHVTWEMSQLLSHLLRIPPPAIISTSPDQARAFLSPELHLLFARLRNLAVRDAENSDDSDESDPLGSDHDGFTPQG